MEPVSVLTTVINAVGSLVAGAVTWCTSFLSIFTATGNELLLIFAVLSIVGLGIGILSRLFRVN